MLIKPEAGDTGTVLLICTTIEKRKRSTNQSKRRQQSSLLMCFIAVERTIVCSSFVCCYMHARLQAKQYLAMGP